MSFALYLTLGLVILWLASLIGYFVNKATKNLTLSAIVWFVSAYLLFELALVLAKTML